MYFSRPAYVRSLAIHIARIDALSEDFSIWENSKSCCTRRSKSQPTQPYRVLQNPPLATLSVEKTMVAKAISDLTFVSRLFFQKPVLRPIF